MRVWISTLLIFIASLVSASAQLSFPETSPVKFSFRETLTDTVVNASEDSEFPEYVIGTTRNLLIEGSAPLTGFDLTDLSEVSPYSISIGDFDTSTIPGLNGRLGDDEEYAAEIDDRINVPIYGFTFNGDEVEVGSISLLWTPTNVTFKVSIGNSNGDTGGALTPIEHTITSEFYREKNEEIDAEDLTAAFSFGPYGFNLRTVYTLGTATSEPDSQDRIPDLLSKVVVEGAIDYLAPTITITSPVPNATTALPEFTIQGTVSDKREVQRKDQATKFYNTPVSLVEVRIDTNLEEGEFVAANLAGNNWILPNALLSPGINYVVVRATDEHGNITTTSPRKLTFLQSGSITVEAAAAGFPGGTPVPAGTVSGAFFTGASKQITALSDGVEVTNSRSNVTAGQTFSVKAKPAPGAVFNGWTATLDNAPYFTSVEETLFFETKPGLVLTAEFVPNPFAPVLGTYIGLVDGDDARERGPFKIAISKAGAFTGKAQFGDVTLPLKGKVLGNGRWHKTISKNGKSYAVSFIVDLTPGGDRLLTGSITSTGFAATISADLKDWRKAKGAVPARLATDYSGTFNVLLRPSGEPDSDAPQGIGYGRVTISELGAVKFSGQLGDGTKVSAGSTLAKRASGVVHFPLFVALDKKLGNLSGYVVYDAQPTHDLTAELTWEEPASTKVEPQAFDDVISLSGSRYVKPLTGTRAMLQAANGNGFITLALPGYDVPVTPVGFAVEIEDNASLDAITHVVTIANSPLTQSLKFKMKINPASGLFTGSFVDPLLNRTITFSGAVDQKASAGNGVAGGVFVRGNRAGSIIFSLPPPE